MDKKQSSPSGNRTAKLSYILFYINDEGELIQVAFSSVKEDLENAMHVYSDRLLLRWYKPIYDEISHLNNHNADGVSRQYELKKQLDKYRDEMIERFFISEVHS
jgi:hypothetical protein